MLSPLPSIIFSVIEVWHPIASIVTMAFDTSIALSNLGTTVISFVFSPTFSWPSDMLLSADQADTIHVRKSSCPRVCSASHLLEPRISLPSMATTPLTSPTISLTQFLKISSNPFGLKIEKKRLKVSWLGIDSSPTKRCLKKSNLLLPNSAISFQDWAPAITAAIVM